MYGGGHRDACGLHTCALISLIPKMTHGVIDFFHLQRMVLHDRADNINKRSFRADNI